MKQRTKYELKGLAAFVACLAFAGNTYLLVTDMTEYTIHNAIIEVKQEQTDSVKERNFLESQKKKTGWYEFMALTNVILGFGCLGAAAGYIGREVTSKSR